MKLAFQELEEKIERLEIINKLIERSPIIIFIWKNKENWPVEYVSNNVTGFLEYTTNDFLSGNILYSEIIHSDDLPRVINEVTENSKNNNSSFEHRPYRVITKSKKTRWIRDITTIRRNKNNEITHYEGIIIDITKQKEVEEKLIKNEEKYKTVADFNTNWEYWIDNNAKLIYISPSCEKITGYSSNEFYASPDLMTEIVHPNDTTLVKTHIHNILKTGGVEPIIFRIITKSGKERWISHICRTVYNQNGENIGQRGSNVDITKQKQLEQKLVESEERFNAIFNNNPNPTHVINTNFEVVLTNSVLLNLKNLKQERILNKKCFKVYQDNTERCQNCAVAEVFNKKTNFKSENKLTLPNGEIKYFETYAYPILDNQNNVIYAVESTIDITKIKEIEKELKKQNIELENKNKLLLTKNKELARFTYIASHDLQEPLNTIIGFSEILKDNYSKKLDGIGLKSLDIISSSTYRMKTLISDLLEYSRIGRNYKIETININEILEDIKTDLTNLINVNKVIFIYDNLLEIQAFKNEIKMLFLNLITNAIKYRKETESPIIKIQVEENQKEYKYCVIDNGIGIDMQFKDKIFEVFCRLHTKDKYSGTGIGLANCYRVVELHKGKIWVESAKGKGSKFIFTIKKRLNDE